MKAIEELKSYLTPQKLKLFYDKHILIKPYIQVDLSEIKNDYVAEDKFISKEQFEKGRLIHEKLTNHFENFQENLRKMVGPMDFMENL